MSVAPVFHPTATGVLQVPHQTSSQHEFKEMLATDDVLRFTLPHYFNTAVNMLPWLFNLYSFGLQSSGRAEMIGEALKAAQVKAQEQAQLPVSCLCLRGNNNTNNF
uniref:Glycosyl transferase n=1 Tax=Echinococcus granulosus TaxID=6210 RepID=A0A068X535_ECHGR|nr:hypothetical protein EgrG_002062800 [Echinococcus granulosus]